MLGKSSEQSTKEWKDQLERLRKMDADFIEGVKADPTLSVHIDSNLYPEFGTSDR